MIEDRKPVDAAEHRDYPSGSRAVDYLAKLAPWASEARFYDHWPATDPGAKGGPKRCRRQAMTMNNIKRTRVSGNITGCRNQLRSLDGCRSGASQNRKTPHRHAFNHLAPGKPTRKFRAYYLRVDSTISERASEPECLQLSPCNMRKHPLRDHQDAQTSRGRSFDHRCCRNNCRV